MRISRRSVLKAATAAAIAPRLPAQSRTHAAADEFVFPENGTLIPDTGWRLWVDEHAPWKEDEIFLPEDVSWIDGKLCGKGHPLPVNAPTGGWQTLSTNTAKAVTLPTSVEQHFWGKFGSRPYTPEEYRYAATNPPAAPADDNVPQNGAYFGVSWFFRPIDIPASMRGKRIFLHIRGAHLRAEVYLNGHLCGYSIMEELPFEADLTHAAQPGADNLLAIRITNPFGRYDWVDGLNAKWGAVSLYRSHGFGALDRGITLSAHNNVCIKNLWVLNTPNAEAIRVRAVLEGTGCPLKSTLDGTFSSMQIIDPATGREMATAGIGLGKGSPYCSSGSVYPLPLTQPKPQEHFTDLFVEAATITCASAQRWSLDRPKLYLLRATFTSDTGDTDTRTVALGFRSFTVEGVTRVGEKSNALFRLNGRRIKLYSAISWGYWGLNGMFPVPELAEKEVTAAKALGLNCLNFHRNLAKTDVLRAHDRLGLLRYMEPGAGKLAVGRVPPKTEANAPGVIAEKPANEAERFAQRYMFTKCVEMVRAHRSHPSVFEYCLQNELGADFKNPATLAVLKAMHDEDPSRLVALNDGFVARGAAQAWYEPWDSELKEGKLHRSDEEKWGGWWNNHQGAGDQWYDEFYKSPTDFTYKAPYREVLTEYGEMEGCARPDVHGLMVHQIRETYAKYGGDSYDLADHEEILAAYEHFLTRWNFRKSFPTADHVFRAVGRTCYESWQNYMENARIADDLDFAVISGWESTAIENHSGIVDNLRNFKSDPALIGDTLRPVRPIAKQHALAIELGKPLTFDLFLANDTPQDATGSLSLTMIAPSGRRTEVFSANAPQRSSADEFCTLVRAGFSTPEMLEEGLYRCRFALSSEPGASQTKNIWVCATIGKPFQTVNRKHKLGEGDILVAVANISPQLRKQLESINGVTVGDFNPSEPWGDLILTSGITARTHTDGQVGETTGESLPAIKPGHTPEPGEVPTPTQLGHIDSAILDAVRTGTPLFVIPQADTLSEGCAQQLAAAGAFTYAGAVGDFRAPWMGNWYFVREHALFDGLPQNCALGGFYQVKGRQSNGLLVDGPDVEIVVAYSRDHDRRIGAGTFTTRLGKGKVLFHRCPDFHPVLQQRFLANALRWLTTT